MRTMPVHEFMIGVKRTALGDRASSITAVTVPVLDGWQGYAKVGVRNAMVIAIAGACLAVDRPARSVRLALGSVGPTIIRATEAEAFAARPSTGTAAPCPSDDAVRFGRAGGRGQPPDRRPPVDGGLPAARRRRAGRRLPVRRAFPGG